MNNPHEGSGSDPDRLRSEWAEPAADAAELNARLARLVDRKADRLPLPGHGSTLERWRRLAGVAGCDLSLVKLYEGHTDALAILAEHGAAALAVEQSRWGMWAAEPPFARVQLCAPDGTPLTDEQTPDGGGVRLEGTKAWCSGATGVSHALLTAWQGDHQRLVAVEMDQPGIEVTDTGWAALGMAPTASVEVRFHGAHGLPVGPAGGYLERPGFWQGGAGIAACWFGGARRLGEILHARALRGGDAHLMAHLGAVDRALDTGAAVLRRAAAWIDARPQADARLVAIRTRASLEHMAEAVMHHCGHALGAGPFCRDPAFARFMADLPVYLRQSHAERDLESLGRALAECPSPGEDEATGGWRL
ncbi:alkylation response protein AidB-like acyl-CoA dehydrogenase [Kushneria sinocarnis]|uniref:Alkylation response protein AidB-like acyl-CoA dehydrogenase n=1 Tax=Kushneria sinocarnis TaxID=595502 RepID=A0A420WSR5_9GAMM|nr:acyl-CoA dehydrogenase family protein [Kushneria sinocarnis]RKQ95708.1 alkylation response protein AidB-like acyl-CoA dehydrogenase [Kushneria sinocarnis]